MQGEKLASGNAHDNVAPALGRIYISTKFKPLDIIRIESPELYTVVHPQIELKTSCRSVLKQTISLKSAIIQWKCGRTNSWFVHQRLRVDRTFFMTKL
jgi:homoserine kinase